MPDFAPLQRAVADSLVNRGIPPTEAERAATEAESVDTTNTVFGLFATAWAIAQRNVKERPWPMPNTHELAMKEAVKSTEASCKVLTGASVRASSLGKSMLKGAHCYLYAAMLADFVKAARRDDWIGSSVKMKDSSIKPTELFIMDHLFGTVFQPLIAKSGKEFLDEVRRKAMRLISKEQAADSGEHA